MQTLDSQPKLWLNQVGIKTSYSEGKCIYIFIIYNIYVLIIYVHIYILSLCILSIYV